MMVHCVEKRFGVIRATHPVQWLSEGSIFGARKIIEIAVALNLERCFMPVEIPESNDMGRGLRENLQTGTMCGSARSRMPPPSASSTAGWRTTTPSTPINPGWAIAHRNNTPVSNPSVSDQREQL
jgi:hypothetical protein